MQPLKRMLVALALFAAAFLATAVNAADLPKQGTFKGTYFHSGTGKATSVGKERLLTVFDETGASVSNGFLDHLTWHCWGMGDFANGLGHDRGYCVALDPVGDQLVVDFADEPHAPGQNSWHGSAKFTGGTGKFAGVSGGLNYEDQAGFRSAAPGTYVGVNSFQGSYKLR